MTSEVKVSEPPGNPLKKQNFPPALNLRTPQTSDSEAEVAFTAASNMVSALGAEKISEPEDFKNSFASFYCEIAAHFSVLVEFNLYLLLSLLALSLLFLLFLFLRFLCFQIHVASKSPLPKYWTAHQKSWSLVNHFSIDFDNLLFIWQPVNLDFLNSLDQD